MAEVGVILCGAGRFDGSEIHESTLTLLHLKRSGAKARCFAPDHKQWATCEHFEGKAMPDAPRNMLEEAARIARGDVQPLASAKAQDIDALILPGGSGAALNLCDFARQGGNGEVLPDLAHLILQMHSQGKPIGGICIAPAILALVLGRESPRLTLGGLDGPALEAGAAGAQLVECRVDEIVIDEVHNLITTPAYILGPGIAEVDAGIEKLVHEVLARCAS